MINEIECYGMSHCGVVRSMNQDRFLISTLNRTMNIEQSNLHPQHHELLYGEVEATLLVVADGMGGHRGGEIASELTVRAIGSYVLHTMPWFVQLSQEDDHSFREELARLLRFSQGRLNKLVERLPGYAGMGTTLTIAYILREDLFVMHVGDSRAYMYRDNQLHRLTRDHTVAQKLVDSGHLDPSLVESSPFSHMLYNAVGTSENQTAVPDLFHFRLQDKDQLLLCSDGLIRHLKDDDIANELNSAETVEDKCKRLVQRAVDGGGSDNITCLIGKVKADDTITPRGNAITDDEFLNDEFLEDKIE